MRRQLFGSSLPILGYACFVAALFLFVKGYAFNTDDQAEHLPQIYQMLDPELYPNDYFVNASNSIFTVRFYYEKLVLTVAETVGLEWGLFILTFLCITLMAYSFARIAEELFANTWSVLLAPLLAMIVFYGFTVGGNHVMYGSFISSTIAKGISSFGLLQFVRGKHVGSGLILGVATLFQPLVGLQLFLIFGGVELLIRKNFVKCMKFGLPFIAISAFILFPTFGRQFNGSVVFNEELYYEILYRFRNHHHYMPSLFPMTHYIKFFGLLGLALLSYYITKPRDKGFYLGSVGFGLIGMLVYWLCLEHFGVLQIGKLQWFKVTVWVAALSSIVIGGIIGQIMSGFSTGFFVRKRLLPISLISTVILLMVMVNSKYLPESFNGKYMVGNREYSDLEKMHFWIEENTDKRVSVLVSPDNNAFSCQAKRSMPIHFQAIVHEPFFMLPWYEDFKEIYGVSIENRTGLDVRLQAVESYQTRNYRGSEKTIDLRIDNLQTCGFQDELGPVVHQEGNWILTEFLAKEAI